MRSQSFSSRDCLAPQGWELAALAGLVVVYVGAETTVGDWSHDTLNVAGPVWLTAVLGLAATRMVLMNPAALWTALFWFRVATAVYFGAGALVPFYVNLATRMAIDAYFRAEPSHMVKVNLIVAVCVVTVLATVSLMARLRRGDPRATDETHHNDRSLLAAGLLFGAVGATIKYLFVLPYTLGLTVEVIPGALLSLSLLTSVAIYLLASWAIASGRAYLPLIVALAGLEIAVGLLGFNKSEVVFSLMMVVLACLRSRVTLMRLAGGAAVIFLCFQTIVPMAEYGRHQLGLRYDSIQGASLAERLEILANYFGAAVDKADEEIQSSIQRLSYMNAAALAVQLYDSGLPGNSLSNVLAVFIPRMFWPNKPIITQVGVDFNVLATGNDQSSSAPGLFAESYWNFGWIGIPLLMVPLALIHFYLSRYALNVIHSGRWLFFPVVLFGMKMGLRVDGHYVADVAGTIVAVVVLHVMLVLVDRLVLVMFRQRADGLVRRTA